MIVQLSQHQRVSVQRLTEGSARDSMISQNSCAVHAGELQGVSGEFERHTILKMALCITDIMDFKGVFYAKQKKM